jgi:hypothetical protein
LDDYLENISGKHFWKTLSSLIKEDIVKVFYVARLAENLLMQDETDLVQ